MHCCIPTYQQQRLLIYYRVSLKLVAQTGMKRACQSEPPSPFKVYIDASGSINLPAATLQMLRLMAFRFMWHHLLPLRTGLSMPAGNEIRILLAVVRAAAPLNAPALQMHLFPPAQTPSSTIQPWSLINHTPFLCYL